MGPIVKHVWNGTIQVLLILFGWSYTQQPATWDSLHLLILKSSTNVIAQISSDFSLKDCCLFIVSAKSSFCTPIVLPKHATTAVHYNVKIVGWASKTTINNLFTLTTELK